MRQGPPADWHEHDAVQEREQELDAVSEKERMAEEAVPRSHPVRRFFAKLFGRR